MDGGTRGPGPLAGRTILITRAQAQARDLRAALEDLGAQVVEAPVIGFAEPRDWGPADAAIARLDAYDWILFTSANAVDRFLDRSRRRGSPAPAGPAAVAAIGEATAGRLRAEGIEPQMVAPTSSSEGLVAALESRGGLAGKRLLIPRAEAARDVLPDRLRAAAATVDLVTVYRTVGLPVAPEVKEMIAARRIDAVAFTSGSTVTHLLAGLGGPSALSGVIVAVIGPITESAARAAGLEPSVVASDASVASLAAAIASHFGAAGGG